MGFLGSLFGGGGSVAGIPTNFGSSSASSNLPAAMSMARSAAGMDSNESCFPTLSYQSRLRGFVACFIIGWILSFASMFALSVHNVNGFVALYSFGNVVCVFSSMFLMGPTRQCRGMFASGRILATLIFFGLLITTIVAAFTTKNVPVVIVCVVLQFFASLWYTLSYIPFAREMCLSICCPSAAGGSVGV